MRGNESLVPGQSVEATIDLTHQTIEGLLDIGFTRGYASSQAYANRTQFRCQERILPRPGAAPPADLDHDMSQCQGEYQWLGFESRATIYALLEEAIADPAVTVDAMLYELSEPELVRKLERLGPRLRAIVDNHGAHGDETSNETTASNCLSRAGAAVKQSPVRLDKLHSARAVRAKQQHGGVYRPQSHLSGRIGVRTLFRYYRPARCRRRIPA